MPISTPSTTQDIAAVEVDVLVVGAGAAGMTAALVSSLEGLDMLLCEKFRPRRRHQRDVGRYDLGCPAPGRVVKPVLRIMSLRRSDISRQ